MIKLIKSFLILLVILCAVVSCTTEFVETGQKPKVIDLPDGSYVLLNSYSSVSYSSDFEDRIINLSGEAFFDVQAGDSPFVVKTELGDVKVLGTGFNVKSNEDELQVEVDEGTVEVASGECTDKIRKGERAVLKKGKDVFEKGKAEFKHHIWTGELQADLKAIGKEIKKSGRKIGKEFQKFGRKIRDEVNDR